MENEAFKTRVLQMSGGLELMLCAGFALAEGRADEAPTTAAHQRAAGGEPVAAAAVAPAGSTEMYLRHPMDPISVQSLTYTLQR